MTIYYIMCKNITDVFRAERALGTAGISCRTVPSPPREAGPCTTVLEASLPDLGMAREVMEKAGIPIVKVIEEDAGRTGLIEKLTLATHKGLFAGALDRVLKGGVPSPEDLQVLLRARGKNREVLWTTADRVRQTTVGDVVDVRAALEISNYCMRNCYYCGLRRENVTLPRYRMTEKEIVREACRIANLGIKTLILQSGEDAWYSRKKVVNIIRSIKRETGMRITLSLGERDPADYETFREVGADNYLLKIETTDSALYETLHPSYSLAKRMNHVRNLKAAGYITGSGNIIGLPGQNLESIAADIIWFWQEGIHMIGIGPFVPAPGTPLEKHRPGSVNLTLNAIAVTRLVCRNSYIPSTTALASLDKGAQLQGLACGANTVMLIMTPAGLREKYVIYGNKLMVDLDWALEMIKILGRQKPGDLQVGEVGGFA